MKKYLSFFRLRFLMGLQYRTAALAGIVTQFAWGGMEILMYKKALSFFTQLYGNREELKYYGAHPMKAKMPMKTD